MATETPWPIDPTPGDMAYVGACSTCYGLTFVCATDHIVSHIPTLLGSLRRGDDLYRISAIDLYKTGWQFCHCRRKEAPNAS